MDRWRPIWQASEFPPLIKKKIYKTAASHNSLCSRNIFFVICDFFSKYNLICKSFLIDLISVIIFFFHFPCVVWKEDGECTNQKDII